MDSHDQMMKTGKEQSDGREFIRTACKRAVSDKLTTYYKKLIDEDVFDDIDLGLGEGNNIVMDLLKMLKGKTDNILDTKNGKNNYCFFTVNFKEDIAHDEIIKVFTAFTKSSVFLRKSEFIYTLEQRSEDESKPAGFHIHILFTKDDNPPSKIQRAFKTKFVDKYCSPTALDYKYVENPDKRIKYCLGIKDDKDKDSKIKVDRAFRKANGYQDYYVQGDQIMEKVEIFRAENISDDLPALPISGMTNSEALQTLLKD